MIADSSEIKLVSSIEVLLHNQDQDTDPNSPKSKIQRKLVALIWLERVLQQNLDSMDEAAYRHKIDKDHDKLVKDTTPATAAMLGEMRTELHQFAVPFYQGSVEDEMKRLRSRQKVLLDQLIALDAQPEEQGAVSDESDKVELGDVKKEHREEKAEPTEKAIAEKQARRDWSNMLIGIMAGVAGVLVCIVITVACVVKTHVASMS